MLTFTEAAANLANAKQALEIEKTNDEELQTLLSNFVNQLSALPAYAKLKSPTTRDDLKKEITDVITKKIEPLSNPLTEEIDHRCFVSGKYDAIIFGENPKVTAEFQKIINKFNTEFIMRLFARCQSVKQLDFWIGKYAKLPKKPIALAIAMGCNIHVLQYLDKKEHLDVLTEEDRPEFMMRAKRFMNSEGYRYLDKKFNELRDLKKASLPHNS